jgi:hypothetical protein
MEKHYSVANEMTSTYLSSDNNKCTGKNLRQIEAKGKTGSK